jgi:hypothetical protein
MTSCVHFGPASTELTRPTMYASVPGGVSIRCTTTSPMFICPGRVIWPSRDCHRYCHRHLVTSRACSCLTFARLGQTSLGFLAVFAVGWILGGRTFNQRVPGSIPGDPPAKIEDNFRKAAAFGGGVGSQEVRSSPRLRSPVHTQAASRPWRCCRCPLRQSGNRQPQAPREFHIQCSSRSAMAIGRGEALTCGGGHSSRLRELSVRRRDEKRCRTQR